GLLVLARRLLRRILRPMLLRQAELFQHLADLVDDHEHRLFALKIDNLELKESHEALAVRQEELTVRHGELSEQIQTTMAFGWDYVALVRRLATLEDQVAALTGVAGMPADEGDPHPSILFPGIEKAPRRTATGEDGEVRSRVC